MHDYQPDHGATTAVMENAVVPASRRSWGEMEAILAAVDRSQAVIEFALNGTVLAANENFLTLFGYAREEVVGWHHRMFCTEEQASSPDYRLFWQRLAASA